MRRRATTESHTSYLRNYAICDLSLSKARSYLALADACSPRAQLFSARCLPAAGPFWQTVGEANGGGPEAGPRLSHFRTLASSVSSQVARSVPTVEWRCISIGSIMAHDASLGLTVQRTLGRAFLWVLKRKKPAPGVGNDAKQGPAHAGRAEHSGAAFRPGRGARAPVRQRWREPAVRDGSPVSRLMLLVMAEPHPITKEPARWRAFLVTIAPHGSLISTRTGRLRAISAMTPSVRGPSVTVSQAARPPLRCDLLPLPSSRQSTTPLRASLQSTAAEKGCVALSTCARQARVTENTRSRNKLRVACASLNEACTFASH